MSRSVRRRTHGHNAYPEANLFGIKIEGAAHDPTFRNRINA